MRPPARALGRWRQAGRQAAQAPRTDDAHRQRAGPVGRAGGGRGGRADRPAGAAGGRPRSMAGALRLARARSQLAPTAASVSTLLALPEPAFFKSRRWPRHAASGWRGPCRTPTPNNPQGEIRLRPEQVIRGKLIDLNGATDRPGSSSSSTASRATNPAGAKITSASFPPTEIADLAPPVQDR